MAGVYETWLLKNIPAYLQGPMGQAMVGPFGKIADSLIADAQAARKEALIT